MTKRPDPEPYRYRCVFCGKRFMGTSDLHLHERFECVARDTMIAMWQRRREKHQAEQS